mmetsp:Transcript_100619/g.313664  ORF Transcript_100619/g.313664 Transcript_100619/m.313664 type:complete len:222 (+) Transcript_100619:184-849(+)
MKNAPGPSTAMLQGKCARPQASMASTCAAEPVRCASVSPTRTSGASLSGIPCVQAPPALSPRGTPHQPVPTTHRGWPGVATISPSPPQARRKRIRRMATEARPSDRRSTHLARRTPRLKDNTLSPTFRSSIAFSDRLGSVTGIQGAKQPARTSQDTPATVTPTSAPAALSRTLETGALRPHDRCATGRTAREPQSMAALERPRSANTARRASLPQRGPNVR